MTTQYAVLPARSGRSYTAKLFTDADLTTEVTGNTITVSELAAKGLFSSSIARATALPAGDYVLVLLWGTLGAAVGYFTFAGTDGETATETPSTVELDSASLIRFITEDTGETAAADGSVAKLSQGSSSGGGDATLANQVEIKALLTGNPVIQVASPNVSGNLVLTQGDDYDGTANPKASWTVTTDYTDGWSVTLTIRDVDDAVIYTTAGTVVSATVVAVTVAAPTGLTMTGCPGQWQGKFDVQLTHTATGKKKTIALGVCYINEDQTR